LANENAFLAALFALRTQVAALEFFFECDCLFFGTAIKIIIIMVQKYYISKNRINIIEVKKRKNKKIEH